MKKTLLAIILGLCVLPVARADEGMWLVQALDKALEKNMKARGLKLDAREIYNEEAGGITDAIVSLGFYCSGSMISDEGLLITNHHCAYSDISALSTPEHNYLEEGYWALNRSREIPIKGKEFFFLRKVLDVTEEVEALKDSLNTRGKPFGGRKIASVMESKYDKLYGMESGLVTMWSGIKHYICLYEKYTDVRLVGAPPVTVAAFGGDEDNWEWPQHKADFALYRIYDKDGQPLKPHRHLTISQKGYKEGDFAMVIGYPGSTSRYMSVAQMHQVIDVQRPELNRLRKNQMETLRKWMNADPAIRFKYSDAFFSLSNASELYEGEAACMKRFDVIPRRRVFEEELRAFSADNAAILDTLEAEYASISAIEKQKVYYRETLVRPVKLVRTFIRMGSTKDDVEKEKELLAAGLEATDYRVEKELLEHSVEEFLTNIDPVFLKPIHKEMMEKFGTDYKAMTQWLWDNSCVAGFGKLPVDEIVAAYEGGIKQDPLYKFMRDLGMIDLNRAEKHVGNLTQLHGQYVRAKYKYLESKGLPQYPDANSTMRLTYGRVLPYQPWDGVYAHWQSTALGLRQKYNPSNYDFHYPDSFREVLPPVDFPVNFLTDNDITGGNSGSPVLDARGRLIGLAFDGNKESLACTYESVPGYNMCVCVDIRYVLWVIRYLGKQEYVLAELGL